MSLNTIQPFQEDRAFWVKCFHDNDPNAIMQQVYDLVHSKCTFVVLNEAIRVAKGKNADNPKFSPLLADFMRSNFFPAHLMRIRRLTEKQDLRKNKHKDVVSILSLLEDMKQKVGLMTRLNFFSVAGLEYDAQKMRKQEEESLRLYINGRIEESNALRPPVEKDADSIEVRHSEFDRLSGVSPDKRSGSDKVRLEFIESMMEKIKTTSDKVSLLANKFIAHATTPESREAKKADEVVLLYGDLEKAEETICRVVFVIGHYLLWQPVGDLCPGMPYGVFEHMDCPLAEKGDFEAIDSALKGYRARVDLWSEPNAGDVP